MIRLYRWTVTLSLESPFMTRGLSVSALGQDASIARDGNGHPYLPGTLLAGVVRSALDELIQAGAAFVSPADIARWFGCESRTIDGVRDAPDRGRVNMHDLIAGEAPPDAGTVTRIRIDEDRGSVATGAMQVVELAYPVGQVVQFSGRVGLLAEEDDANRFARALGAALAHVDAIGAFKSAGFGRIEDRAIVAIPDAIDYDRPRPDDAVQAVLHENRAHSSSLSLTLRFDRPFLVNAARVAGNVFQGAEIIPGAVIKGALARRLELAGVKAHYDDALSAIRIGHAFPMAEDASAAPRPIPLSLAVVKGEGSARFVDLIRDAEGDLLHGAVPLFSADWKDPERTAATEMFGWPAVERDMRTRTAIDPDTGTAAEDEDGGKLFTYSAVVPTGLKWTSRIDLPDTIPDEQATELLSALNGPLIGIGKTDAIADVSVHVGTAQAPDTDSEEWIVTLASDAVLNDVAALRSGRTLHDDYAAYWQDAVGLRLVRFFAAQKLAGGYLAYRHRPDGSSYEPYLVTAAGSTFALQGPLGEPLKRAMQRGLPLPARHADATYRNFPFLPENGFGEIVAANTATAPAEFAAGGSRS